MRVRLGLVAVGVMVVGVACTSSYQGQPLDYTPSPGNPPGFVKPDEIAIHMQSQQVTDPDALCVLGVGIGGVGVVATAAAAPAAITAWAVFGTMSSAVSSGFGLGTALGYCWNTFQYVKRTFDVYTSCPVGKPTLETTLSDYNNVVAYVNLASCYCSLSCQWGFRDGAADWWDWAGLPTNSFIYQTQKNYWNDGSNHVYGPVTTETSPDWNAMAASMGLTYNGCGDTGGYACTPR